MKPLQMSRRLAASALLAIAPFASIAATPEVPVAPRLLDPSELVLIGPETLREEIRISGTAAASEHVTIAARVPGRIGEVRFRAGEAVRAGDLLVVIEDEDLGIALRSREAAADNAGATLAQARRVLERNEELRGRGAVAVSALDEARAAFEQADAQHRSSLADLDAARLDLERSRVLAPIDGIIAERAVEPGQLVQSGTDLMRVLNTDVLVLEAAVPFVDAMAISPGMTAVLSLPAGPDGTFAAHVDRVGPELDPDARAATAYLEIANENGDLRAGAFLTGSITRLEAPDAISVPATAITTEEGAHSVTAIRDGKAVRIRVTPGRAWSAGTRIEVVEGLTAGDRVLIAPMSGLGDGDPVEIGE